ncbi:hypothetical protein KAJ27_10140, partial [bacterium]|nr:hypothetical protein [bacterium]
MNKLIYLLIIISLSGSLLSSEIPKIGNIRVTGNSGDISVLFDLSSSLNDGSGLKVQYRCGDSENNWYDAAVSVSGKFKAGKNNLFTWESYQDEMEEVSEDYILKLTPYCVDKFGESVESTKFNIDNRTVSFADSNLEAVVRKIINRPAKEIFKTDLSRIEE